VLSAVRSRPPGDAPRLLLAADRRGRTALSYAAERGSEPIVRALLQLVERESFAQRSACSVLDAADTYGRTPLSYACDRGHAAIVRRLLEAGSAAINTPDAYGTRPLHKAAAFARAAVLQQLLARADVELDATVGVPTVAASFEAKSGEETAAHLAARAGAEGAECLGLLLASGADPNVAALSGETPLHAAVHAGSLAGVQLLLAHGAAIGAEDGDGLE
jgi:ankyrin repeat protein